MNEMQRTRNVLISIVNQHLFGITTRGLYNKYRKELNGSSPISKSAMISLIANQLSDVIGSHTLGRVVFYRPVVTKHSANTLPSNREQSPVATLSFPTSIENEWDREPEPQETWTRLSYERELEIYSLEFPQSVAAILKPNTMEVVRVSQINAPSKFWIQLQNHDVELEKLHQNLRNRAEQTARHQAVVYYFYECFCLRNYSKFYRIQNNPIYQVRMEVIKEKDYYVLNKNDGWFRCMVERIDDGGLNMRLVDYGTLLLKISIADVRVLDPRFYKTPILSVACKLNDIRPLHGNRAFTLESARHFMNLTTDRSFNAHFNGIRSMENTVKMSVKLFDINSNVCINEEMVKAGHAMENAEASVA